MILHTTIRQGILWILITLVTNQLQAQEAALPNNIQSPTAGSLGKYGDVPVSYYNGTPNLNVPIQGFDIRGVSLNLSVNYDASGVMPNNHSGWVGQNWSLSAGGVITRSAQGYADEYRAYSGHNLSEYVHSYTENVAPPYGGGPNEFSKHDYSNPPGLKDVARLVITTGGHVFDFQPDIFSFNFMGISGKFFLGNDGEWKIISDSNLEVIHDYTALENYTRPFIDIVPGSNSNGTSPEYFDWVMAGFKIRDDQGNVYTFGYDQNAIEYSIPIWNQMSYSPFQNGTELSQWTANSWFLTNVTDKHGNELYTFQYERDHFIANLYKSFSAHEKYCRVLGGPLLNSDVWVGGGGSVQQSVSGSLISPVYLSRIQTGFNDDIVFNRSDATELEYEHGDIAAEYQKLVDAFQTMGSPSAFPPLYFLQTNSPYNYAPPAVTGNYPLKALKWKKLDNISITNKGFTRKVDFVYNNIASERLSLLGVNVGAGAENMSYQFDYDRFDQLPKYLSERIDHWGYFRNGQSVIEKDQLDQYYYERSTDFNYAKIGSIKSISFPTGGTSTFEFETHDYSKILNDARNGFLNETGIAGGLRIKKIINDYGDQLLTKEFKYIQDYELGSTASSGILSYKPNYYWDDWRVTSNQGTVDHALRESVFSSNTLIPQANSFGGHMEYSQVVELRSDGSYIQHKFTTNEDFQDEIAHGSVNIDPSPYQKFNDLSNMRGKLKETGYFDLNHNPVKRVVMKYRTDTDMYNNFDLSCNVGFGYACNNNANDELYFKGDAWKIYHFRYDLIEQEDITYDGAASLSVRTTFLNQNQNRPSANIRLPKETSQYVSDGIITSKFMYPLDLDTEPFMSDLANANRLGELIKTQIFKNNIPIGVNKHTYKSENGLILPAKLEVSSSDEAQLRDDMFYDAYSEQGNLVQYHKVNDMTNVILWGYYDRYQVASLQNATYDQVKQDANNIEYWSTQDDDQCLESENCKESFYREMLDRVRKSAPEAYITTYTYDPHKGITSSKDPSGRLTYYQYDDLGRLISTQDHEGNIVQKIDYHQKGQ